MIRPIRRLLTLAGRSGGRVSVIDYGQGLAIAAATHPIELVVNLDAAQVDELIDVLEEWRLLNGATRQPDLIDLVPEPTRSTLRRLSQSG